MKHPDIEKDYKIEFPRFDESMIKKILMEHDFSEERIESQFEKIREIKESKKQRTLF